MSFISSSEPVEIQCSSIEELKDMIIKRSINGKQLILAIKKFCSTNKSEVLDLLQYIHPSMVSNRELIAIMKALDITVFNSFFCKLEEEKQAKEEEIRKLKEQKAKLEERVNQYSNTCVPINVLMKLKMEAYQDAMKNLKHAKGVFAENVSKCKDIFTINFEDIAKDIAKAYDRIEKIDYKKENKDEFFRIRSFYLSYADQLKNMDKVLPQYNEFIDEIVQVEKAANITDTARIETEEILKTIEKEMIFYQEQYKQAKKDLIVYSPEETFMYVKNMKETINKQFTHIFNCRLSSIMLNEKLLEVPDSEIPKVLNFEIIQPPYLKVKVMKELEPESFTKGTKGVFYNKEYMYNDTKFILRLANSFTVMNEIVNDNVNVFFYVLDGSQPEVHIILQSFVEYFKNKFPFTNSGLFIMNKKHIDATTMNEIETISSLNDIVILKSPTAKEALFELANTVLKSFAYSNDSLPFADTN